MMIAPLPTLRTDDQIAGYWRPARRRQWAPTPHSSIQDFPQTFSVQMTPAVIRAHR